MTMILPIWRALASQFSDAHKQCGIMKISKDRDACLAKARMQYAKKKIEILKKAIGKCSSNKKDSLGCKKTLLTYISKEEKKYKDQSDKLKKLLMKGRIAGEGPANYVTTR